MIEALSEFELLAAGLGGFERVLRRTFGSLGLVSGRCPAGRRCDPIARKLPHGLENAAGRRSRVAGPKFRHRHAVPQRDESQSPQLIGIRDRPCSQGRDLLGGAQNSQMVSRRRVHRLRLRPPPHSCPKYGRIAPRWTGCSKCCAGRRRCNSGLANSASGSVDPNRHGYGRGGVSIADSARCTNPTPIRGLRGDLRHADGRAATALMAAAPDRHPRSMS